MKIVLAKRRLFIRKLSMTADTTTNLRSLFLRHNLRTLEEATNRHRDIIWYNPPFSRNVATNVGRSFPKILNEESPKGHALHKIFNRNTVKISYSCMPNLKQKIDGHNKSTLRKTNAVPPKTCNYRQPAHCPLDGNCLKSAVIYQAIVATEDNRPAETYVGLTENSFKTRYSNHKSS